MGIICPSEIISSTGIILHYPPPQINPSQMKGRGTKDEESVYQIRRTVLGLVSLGWIQHLSFHLSASNLSRPPAHTLPHTNLHVRKHISNLQLQMCESFPHTWISKSQLSVAVDDGFLTGTIQPVNYHLSRLARKRMETVPKAALVWIQTPRCRGRHLWWHALLWPSIGFFQNRIRYETNQQQPNTCNFREGNLSAYLFVACCYLLLQLGGIEVQIICKRERESQRDEEEESFLVEVERAGERESKRAAVVAILCWACRE